MKGFRLDDITNSDPLCVPYGKFCAPQFCFVRPRRPVRTIGRNRNCHDFRLRRPSRLGRYCLLGRSYYGSGVTNIDVERILEGTMIMGFRYSEPNNIRIVCRESSERKRNKIDAKQKRCDAQSYRHDGSSYITRSVSDTPLTGPTLQVGGAVWWLTTSSNRIGCTTAGLADLTSATAWVARNSSP
jgi:hypothetical protein